MQSFFTDLIITFLALNFFAYFYSYSMDIKILFSAAVIFSALASVPIFFINWVLSIIGLYSVLVFMRYHPKSGILKLSINTWIANCVIQILISMVFVANVASELGSFA